MNALLLALLLALGPPADAGAGATPARESGHDLHVSYGAAAVEGNVLAVRIRFFKDDLEGALARHAGLAAYSLRPGAEADASFLAYLRAHFVVTAQGRALEPTLVGSGEDELDRESVWWFVVQFEAAAPLAGFRVRNTLLLELFDDQTNIVKFVHFPDQKQKTYSFGEGAEQFDVSFP